MAWCSSSLSAFCIVPGQKGKPGLSVAPEVEAFVLGGPEGVSSKNQETQGGCPASFSNSYFTGASFVLSFPTAL